jgi:flagellar motor switch protein FliM
VEARAFLAQTSIKLNELLSLSVGDVITTDKPCEREVLIQVEGKNKFLGEIGQFRGNRAIKIVRKCEQAEAKVEKPGERA